MNGLSFKIKARNQKWFILSETGLASTAISLNSTTSGFSVFWNNPTSQYALVSSYEVIWRVSGFSTSSSGQLGSTENQYTVTSNLVPGQLYLVNVISHVDLTDPTQSIVVASVDTEVRLGTQNITF